MFRHPKYGYCIYFFQLLWTFILLTFFSTGFIAYKTFNNVYIKEINNINIYNVNNSSFGFMINFDDCIYYHPKLWINYDELSYFLSYNYKIGSNLNVQNVNINDNNFCQIIDGPIQLVHFIFIFGICEMICVSIIFARILVINESNKLKGEFLREYNQVLP